MQSLDIPKILAQSAPPDGKAWSELPVRRFLRHPTETGYYRIRLYFVGVRPSANLHLEFRSTFGTARLRTWNKHS